MESPWMGKPSRWNRLPSHHLKVVGVDHLHLHEAEAHQEVFGEEEEEVEELEDLPHVEGTWMMVAIP